MAVPSRPYTHASSWSFILHILMFLPYHTNSPTEIRGTTNDSKEKVCNVFKIIETDAWASWRFMLCRATTTVQSEMCDVCSYWFSSALPVWFPSSTPYSHVLSKMKDAGPWNSDSLKKVSSVYQASNFFNSKYNINIHQSKSIELNKAFLGSTSQIQMKREEHKCSTA